MPSIVIPRLLELLSRVEMNLASLAMAAGSEKVRVAIEQERLSLERIIDTILTIYPYYPEQSSSGSSEED